VHCEEPFSKLTNTWFLQLGHSKMAPRAKKHGLNLYESTFQFNNMFRAIATKVNLGLKSRN